MYITEWSPGKTISIGKYLKSPLSTNTQWRRSPMALWTIVAATVESTPPESAQMACAVSPIVDWINSSCSLRTSCSFQSATIPLSLKMMCFNIAMPCTVCVTYKKIHIPFGKKSSTWLSLSLSESPMVVNRISICLSTLALNPNEALRSKCNYIHYIGIQCIYMPIHEKSELRVKLKIS